MPRRQHITPERVELDAASQAALDAIEASRAEPIAHEVRLEDPRLAAHRGLIQSNRTIITGVADVLPLLEEFITRMKAKPVRREFHPLAARLKARQDAQGLTLEALIGNALGYTQLGKHVAAHAALISAVRIYGTEFPTDETDEAIVAEVKMAEPKAASEPTKLERAIAAVKASPEKSTRTIAAEIGVSHQTVKRAREEATKARSDVTPDVTQTASESKPMTKKKRRNLAVPTESTDAANAIIREVLEFVANFSNEMSIERKFAKPDREAIIRTLHQCGVEFTLLAQQIEEEA
jgi:hypothetical protein